MPKLNSQAIHTGGIGGSNFTFTGARIEDLGATEYTLVTIAVDETGSVEGFEDELRKLIITVVDACKRSPRSDNLLLRVILFSSSYASTGGVREIHGFKPLAEIDSAKYPVLTPGGVTPLCDASFSSIGAMNAYAKSLQDNDFGVNGIVFILTDGDDNASKTTPSMVQDEMAKAVRGESIESLVSVLVGVNASQYRTILESFQKEAGITQYVDTGDATKGRLAKLAGFVSQSISSQSQALGTGGPSQNISTTF